MEDDFAVLFNVTAGSRIQEVIGNNLIDIEPGNFVILDESFPSNTLHKHYYYEICLVVSGKGEFFYDDQVLKVAEGDLFISNPNIQHEIRLEKDNNSNYKGKLGIVFFTLKIISDVISKESNLLTYEEEMFKCFLFNHLILLKSQKQLFSYFYFLKEYKECSAINQFTINQFFRTMAYESLFLLIENKYNLDNKMVTLNTTVNLAIKYIDNNLERYIYINDIAVYCSTSIRNLQYLFKKHLNKTIINYINEKRILLAMGYLKMNFEVNKVSSLVGINDPAQFSRLFKKYKGFSPSKLYENI